MERELQILDKVNTKEKLIDYILNGNFSEPKDDWDRYAIELFERNRCVTTRLSRVTEEGEKIFRINILIQEDLNFEEYHQEKPYPYLDAHWSDTEWIDYLSGKMSEIDSIITDEVYNNLFVKMNEILTDEINRISSKN